MNGLLPIIREYKSGDKREVLALLRLNTPVYFAPEENDNLLHYLDHEIEAYFVIQLGDKVVGSGGINFSKNKNSATISWDLIHPDFQRKALGRMLLIYRLEEIKKIASIQKVSVRTTQLVYQFYEKNGFKLLEISEDYWAKGFHLYNMVRLD